MAGVASFYFFKILFVTKFLMRVVHFEFLRDKNVCNLTQTLQLFSKGFLNWKTNIFEAVASKKSTYDEISVWFPDKCFNRLI